MRGGAAHDTVLSSPNPSFRARAMRVVVNLPLAAALALSGALLFATSALANDETPVVSASIDPQSATVGDRMTLTLHVEAPKGTDVDYPDVASEVAPLTVLSSATTGKQEQGEGVVEDMYYVLAAFETGKLGIPQLPFDYRTASGDSGVVWTDSMTVDIASVIPDTLKDKDSGPRDIKPPIDLPVRVWPYVLAAAVVAAALAGLWYLRKWWMSRKRRPAEQKPVEQVVPKRAAHLVALERLDALEADDPAGRGDVVGFYVRVTEIVRMYIRDRFGVDAIDMTTAELTPAMMAARIELAEVDWAVEYLSHADLAKFAKYAPGPERPAQDLAAARAFVERTRFLGDESADDGETGSGPAEPGDESAGGSAAAREGVSGDERDGGPVVRRDGDTTGEQDTDEEDSGDEVLGKEGGEAEDDTSG